MAEPGVMQIGDPINYGFGTGRISAMLDFEGDEWVDPIPLRDLHVLACLVVERDDGGGFITLSVAGATWSTEPA